MPAKYVSFAYPPVQGLRRDVVLIHGEVAADFRKGEKTREEILDLMAGGEKLQSLAAELEAGSSHT